MSGNTDAVGDITLALSHAMRLLETAPDRAVEQAVEILKVVPNHSNARLILGAAHRRSGRPEAAVAILDSLTQENPQFAAAFLELGVAAAEAGRFADAIAALRRAAVLHPGSADTWRYLADALDAVGDNGGSDSARAQYIKVANRDPRLMDAAVALVSNELRQADGLLRTHLESFPTDVAAMRMLAEVAGRLRLYGDAQSLLEQCLELAPSFDGARYNYAIVLNRQSKPALALEQVQRLLAKEPRHSGYLNLRAAILANLGDYGESLQVFESVLRDHGSEAKIWMSYGHALRTAHRTPESIAAYRRAIALQPTLGEAYWSLANLKTYRFSSADEAGIQDALRRVDLSKEDRLHFEFTLGKALEDRNQFEESFAHYSAGNAIRRQMHPYSPEDNSRFVARCKRQFTQEFFESRRSSGTDSGDPIFIVGLPRAGSTLLEQILASHSLVEGTVELPDISHIVRRVAGQAEGDHDAPFFEELARLGPAQLRALGEEYLHSTRVHRKSSAPFFIDKMPNNFLHIGLIHLILPNAKIIDARRHPMGCCFSGFKQHFARGQNFAYDQVDLGRYYCDYVELMTHFDAVLPGRVHRVFYESMIQETEAEVRRLLGHCGLSFEESCLSFYENERPVRTPSSEQVRRPIFSTAMEHWRNYEPWLNPLKHSLGTLIAGYPEARDYGQ